MLLSFSLDLDVGLLGEVDQGCFTDMRADPDDIIILCKTFMFHAHLSQKPLLICPASFCTKLHPDGPKGSLPITSVCFVLCFWALARVNQTCFSNRPPILF